LTIVLVCERAYPDSNGKPVSRRDSFMPEKRMKSMTDLIYIAVVVLFCAASGRYAGWCEKL
jgi:hypothetical protein